MQSLEQLVETCKKYIDVAITIEFEGLEYLRGTSASGDCIKLYRYKDLTTIGFGEIFEYEVYKNKEKVHFELGVDFELINKELEDFFVEKMPDFSLNYQKDNLRVELEKLEERRASIERLLNGEEEL